MDPAALQGSVLANLVAGMGDGWSSRAGVVLNPQNSLHTGQVPQLTSTHSTATLNGASLPFAQYATKSASENILLSPQHFIESSKTVGSESGNLSILQNGGINPMLLNLDISASNFTNAMKFPGVEGADNIDTLDNRATEDEIDGQNLNPDPEDAGSEYEEQSIASDLSAGQGECEEQNRLMDRFKQLRQWQVEQQELLMLQQQQQLEALRGEQEKVQRMIARQREAAITTGNDRHTGTQAAGLSHLPPTSPRKQTVVANKHPSQRQQQQRTPPSRPRPVLPSIASTPTEYREHGNPNLDSDTASTCTANTQDAALDEGVVPLPDTATDMADFLRRKKSLLHQQQQEVVGGEQKPSAAVSVSQQPSQFLKQKAPEGGFPRKVLNFDPSETESQADLAGLADHMTESGAQNQRAIFPQADLQVLNGESEEDKLASLGYTNLLNVPGIMQSLPDAILQQLLSLQQQGHNVVVDANGQLAVLPMTLQNSSQHTGGIGGGEVNPRSKLMGQGNNNKVVNSQHAGLISNGNMESAESFGYNTSQLHPRDYRSTGRLVVESVGMESPPVHDEDHARTVENKVLDFRVRAGEEIDSDDMESDIVTEEDKDEVGSYVGKVRQGQQRAEVKHLDSHTGNDLHGQKRFREDDNVASNSRSSRRNVQQGQTQRIEGDVNDQGSYPRNVWHGPNSGEDYGGSQRPLDHTDYVEEVVEDQVMKSEDSETEEEEEETDLKATAVLDDVPVAGLGAKQKTFEELLEEELRKEEQRLAESGASGSGGSNRKPFLRKGEGSARFGVDGKPPKRPQPVKRKSKPSVPSAKSGAVTGAKSGGQGATSKNTGATKQGSKKQPVGRKTAPLRSKPPEKLQLKPSPKKPPKSSTTKASGDPTGADGKLNSQQVPKTSLNLRKTAGSQKSKQSENSRKPSGSGSNSDTGDMSFQTGLREIAKKEEVEYEELEEFEILEQFADDNASFLSNLSAVNRALTQQKKADTGKTGNRPLSLNENNDDTIVETNLDSEDETVADVTLTEEPGKVTGENNGTESTKAAPHTVGNNPILARLKSMKPIQRKVVPLGERSGRITVQEDTEGDQEESDENNLQLSRVEQFSDSDSDTDTTRARNHRIGEKGNSSEGTDVKRQIGPDSSDDEGEGATQPRLTEGGGRNGVPTHRDQAGGSERLDRQREKREDNTDVEEEESEFGDGEAWEDESRGEDDWEREFSKSSKQRTGRHAKPVLESKCEEGRQTPPTSKLVSKLFPKLRPDKPKVSKHQTDQLSHTEAVAVGDGVQAKQLRDKLAELEREIERFRGENSTLEKLRREREEGLEHLKREMSEFQKQKDDELKRIQEYRAEETRKLKREKKLFEDYQKSIRNMPNKKEREEIEALKQQVSELQDEVKRKETRWTASTTRLRDRIEQLEQENSELREEVRVIEQRRLEAWQQKEALATSSKSTFPSKQSESLTSSKGSEGVSQKSTLLKKSSSGPQLSSRSISHRQHGDLPEPVKHGGSTLQRDHALRLSSTADILQGDTVSRLSLDSEAIQPEDSASNVIANRLAHPQPHPCEPHSLRLSLKSSTESKDSDHTQTGTGKKPVTRKKASGQQNASSVSVEKGDGQCEEIQHQDGKVERVYTNGAREILFSNGTRKQVSADSQSVIVSFFNGDVKQILPDKRVVYYYSEAETTHTTYPDGLEILQFANQQSEKHYPDGTKEITFPDQTVKYLFPNGIEESIFPDGTVIRVEKSGDKTMEFPNGQREIHTPQYKRREYPDGTVKTVYPDGRQETRYSSGRIRVKDREGAVIVDRRV